MLKTVEAIVTSPAVRPLRRALHRRHVASTSCLLLAFFVVKVPCVGAALCPNQVRLDVDPAAVDFDAGWTGFFHDVSSWGGIHLTAAVNGCAGGIQGACGECSLSGPVPNGGGIAFDNRRCRGANDGSNGTWVRCTTDAECEGPGNACVFFLGPPVPIVKDITAPVCVTSEITGALSGVVEPDAGSMALSFPFVQRVYGFTSPKASPAGPCPRCESNACTYGPRRGRPCVPNAVHPEFGATSFDCPPPTSNLRGELAAPHSLLSTDVQTLTLSDDSPDCTENGYQGLKCLCDTCDDIVATPCATNADCTAVGATTCGGLRCFNGTTPGRPCVTDADCCSGPSCIPGETATCGRAGQPTQPNDCRYDGRCIAALDEQLGGGSDEGMCAVSPQDFRCAMAPARTCASDGDCGPGDTCAISERRECFFDADGTGSSTGTVTATGTARPPEGKSATIGLASLACIGPIMGVFESVAVNSVIGLPGLARLKFGKVTVSFVRPLCNAAPEQTCRAARKTRIAIETDRRGRQKLQWKWREGEATPRGAFGNPLSPTGTDYELCIYDAVGLVAHVPVPAASVCDDQPCWHEKLTMLAYHDHDAENGGITDLRLVDGSEGKAKIIVKGKDIGAEPPDLGTLSSPVTVQLVNSDGECWGSVYAFPPALRIDRTHFKDTGD